MPDGGERTAHPTVVHFRPGREIRWRDRPGLPGIMDVESSFKIEPLGPEQVRFVHWQSTSGLFALLSGGGSDTKRREELQAMNEALKGQVEHGPGSENGVHADPRNVPVPGHVDRRHIGAPTA
jgi:hypothetical protein